MVRNVIALIFLVQSSFAQDNWTIKVGEIDPNNYCGITVANGMIGIVSSPRPLQVQDVILNGAYDNYQRGRVSNNLKVFNHLNMWIELGGRRLNEKNVGAMSQKLNMKEAIFKTGFVYEDKLRVNSEIMALRHLPFTSMHMIQFEALADIEIVVASVIEAPNHLMDVRNYFAEIDRPHMRIPLLTSVARSPTGKLTVAASNSFIFPEKHGSTPSLIHEDWDYNMHLAKFKKRLIKGEKYQFAIIGSVVGSHEFTDPFNEAERLTVFAALEGLDRLRKKHLAEWQKLWEGDIIVEGDDMAQRGIRSALYHLYSFVMEDSGPSLSPMGLSGLGYNGHVFWDTELWMHPNIAKSLLDYRYNRLEMAKENAFAHGYKGATFLWESAEHGSEDTPVWAITGPFEHHISGCVAWAAWKYYQVTKDKKWLKTKGYPILREVADFWVSRVEKDQQGRFHINNVVGANEWEENVDNEAFTNGIAILSLRYADQASQILDLPVDPEWREVADRIVIEKFPDGTTLENRTFERGMIKQADVNLLSFPLDLIRDPEQMKKDFSFYEPLMAPDGPAIGFSVLAAIYARLGIYDGLYDKFLASYKNSELPPFGVLAETACGTNPYFATGAGGILQLVLMGIGGLEINDDGIVQLPTTSLPPNWKSLKLMGVGPQKSNFIIVSKTKD